MQVYSERTIMAAGGVAWCWRIVEYFNDDELGYNSFGVESVNDFMEEKLGCCGLGWVDHGGRGASSRYPDIWR